MVYKSLTTLMNMPTQFASKICAQYDTTHTCIERRRGSAKQTEVFSITRYWYCSSCIVTAYYGDQVFFFIRHPISYNITLANYCICSVKACFFERMFYFKIITLYTIVEDMRYWDVLTQTDHRPHLIGYEPRHDCWFLIHCKILMLSFEIK